jgi:hypothetical protein
MNDSSKFKREIMSSAELLPYFVKSKICLKTYLMLTVGSLFILILSFLVLSVLCSSCESYITEQALLDSDKFVFTFHTILYLSYTRTVLC